jgi:phospholipid/cholesterol/gamma-HCH transport system permease protein
VGAIAGVSSAVSVAAVGVETQPPVRGAKLAVPPRAPTWKLTDATLYERLQSAGDMGALAVKTVRLAVKPPFRWYRDAVVEVSSAFRRCVLPLIVSHSVYLIGYGIILFGAILANLGVVERESGAIFLIWAREIATWITGMVFAGIVGSAITADLGARKIREELDALDVLGVRKVDTLVVPRIVATTVAMPLLVILSLAVVILINFILAPTTLGFSNGVWAHNLKANILPLDLIFPTLIKNTILGFFVGVVACHKGLTCKAGAEGVGRAVNQTVVITFFGIWLFNSVFNLGYLTLFPDTGQFRG